ncbi:interleukin-6 receptor subunit beta [Haplochromis burtoni]|uniref:Interleukin-6 receptor subunit beta-like n=1 Tax=Haplochromis burtoni TaxID=8153 RepID=A0A3Q2WKP2_HAPBU|nr:interleukin-6 receptor subunit beta [Haplochromis burtoni]
MKIIFTVKMDVWVLKVHFCTWTVMSLLIGVFSYGVTVRDFQLEICKENTRVCVTTPADCDPRPPSSTQSTLNMSCYYQKSADRRISMTCEWSLDSNSDTETTASLIFSRDHEIISCQGIFNSASIVNVTARIKNHMTEIWSEPHSIFLFEAVKPPTPVLTVLSSTEDSLVVSWTSSGDGRCQLRYRLDSEDIWTKVPDLSANLTLNYTIKDLLPFTVYRAAVACREQIFWSNWSSEMRGRTLDRVPSRPPEVFYRLEKKGGSLEVHLIILKTPESLETEGRILGYQMSYKEGGLIQNTTDVTRLVVKEGNCSITVRAFNTAGYGPAAHLSFSTQRQKMLVMTSLPSVRNMWISTSYPGKNELLVQWKIPINQGHTLPVSYFLIQWHPEMSPSTSHWSRVDGFITSTVIRDVDPNKEYLISVFPVYNQQYGSRQSLPASLQYGALMEVVNLSVSVTKTSVTIMWEWQRKSEPVRVSRYEAVLRKDSDKQSLPLWPDDQQHTFYDLMPNAQYSVTLLADNVSKSIVQMTTDFDDVTVVATAIPLLLVAVTVLILSILSRNLYKSYFFPLISSPRLSKTGQWLMDPNHEKFAERSILNIEDFQVTDVLRDKSLIIVERTSQLLPDDDQREDTSLLLIGCLTLDSEYVSYSAQPTENQSRPPIKVFISEENQEAAGAPLHETKLWLPQSDKDRNQADISEISHQTEAAVRSHFPGLLTESQPVYPMTCETEYVLNWGRQSDCSYLICDAGYISNSDTG